jgi:hypothetical protein
MRPAHAVRLHNAFGRACGTRRIDDVDGLLAAGRLDCTPSAASQSSKQCPLVPRRGGCSGSPLKSNSTMSCAALSRIYTGVAAWP